jgi:hypothetical protein
MDPNKIDCGARVLLKGDNRLYLVRAVRNYSVTPDGKRTKGYEVRLADDQAHVAAGGVYRWVIRDDIERKVSNK